MKLLRPLAGYTLYNHKTNNSIRKELRITNILDKIDEYRKKWLLHIKRMPQNRIPLTSYNYRPQGRRSIGRPKKRWREQDNNEYQFYQAVRSNTTLLFVDVNGQTTCFSLFSIRPSSGLARGTNEEKTYNVSKYIQYMVS